MRYLYVQLNVHHIAEASQKENISVYRNEVQINRHETLCSLHHHKLYFAFMPLRKKAYETINFNRED